MVNDINSRFGSVECKVHESFVGSKDYMKFHNKIRENKFNKNKFEILVILMTIK